MVEKLPYRGRYPEALKQLMADGLIKIPRQTERKTRVTAGVDITYTLNWRETAYEANRDTLLLAIYQDLQRYKNQYPEALMYGKVGALVGTENRDIGVHTWKSADAFVYGPGYKVDQYWLERALDNIFKEKYKGRRVILKNIYIRIHSRIV